MLTFLWCVPRSISTAFEKMIWNSGEFEVVSEPFLDLYKQSLLSDEDRAEVKTKIRAICDELLMRSEHRPIFVKDMAYHAEQFICDDFIRRTNHAFLIRNPKLSIPSLYEMRADYEEVQTGFEGQLALFERIHNLTGSMPKGILSWPAGSLKAWAKRESWHLKAINSTGFERKLRPTKPTQLPEKVAASIDRNMDFYNALCENIKHIREKYIML